MTEPTESTGRINTFIYDATHHTMIGRDTTIFVYEGSNLLLPVRERTTSIYEDDGKGSAVLRETIPARSPSEILAAMQPAPFSARMTFTYEVGGRRISESDTV